MVKLIYIDTSVVGGVYDKEFELWTKIFFDQVNKWEFKIAVSELLVEELKPAPKHIRDYIFTLPESQVLVANYGDEAASWQLSIKRQE